MTDTSQPVDLSSKELAALIRERYTRDNWSGLTYDEAMQVAAMLDATTPETSDVDPNSKEALSLDLEKVQTELDVMTRRYELLAEAAKDYVATGTGASAIYAAMEWQPPAAKATYQCPVTKVDCIQNCAPTRCAIASTI